MKVRRLLIPLIALSLMLATASCASLAVAAATVNGEKISETDVEHELDRVRKDPQFQDLLKRQADQVRGYARRQILNALIQQHVISQEATRRKIRVMRSQTEQLVAQEAQRSGETVEGFLKQQNLTADDADELARRIVQEAELRRRVVGSLGVTQADVQDFYTQNVDAFSESHLLRITVKSAADAAVVLEELAKKDFAAVAEERSVDPLGSQGGDMGYVPVSELSAAVRSAVAGTSVGGSTDPIPGTAGGFEIYRVLDRRTRPIGEVGAEIRARLEDQARVLRFSEWLAGRVGKATVVVNPKYGRFDKRAPCSDRAGLCPQVVAGSGRLRP